MRRLLRTHVRTPIADEMLTARVLSLGGKVGLAGAGDDLPCCVRVACAGAVAARKGEEVSLKGNPNRASRSAKWTSGPQSAAAGVNATFSQASTCSAMHGVQSRSALFGRAVGSFSSICPMSSRKGAL